MHPYRFFRAAFALCAALQPACDGGGGAATVGERAAAAEKARIVAASVAATVDGEPIGLDEVRAAMDEADAGLTAEQALDALIDEHVLAREAARRGVGGVDVDIERARAMARRLVLKIRDETTVDDIDQRALLEDYERQRARFVHGPERRVIHAVVKTGKGPAVDPAAAEKLAQRIRAAEDGASSADDFAARAEPFQKEAGGAVKIESLPPFSAGSKRFVPEFVAAAFAVPKVGGVSPPFATSFGWHVLYVIEELPAQDVPFAEARRVLAEERLPREREKRIVELVQRLSHDNPTFLYESPAPAAE